MKKFCQVFKGIKFIIDELDSLHIASEQKQKIKSQFNKITIVK